jgi:hypothetical protein
MSYAPYDSTRPSASVNGTTFAQHTREQLAALRDMLVAGAPFGWNYSWSGGTADRPTTVFYARGTERVRGTITYGTSGGAQDNPTTIGYAYSPDSGTTYHTIGTMTVTYTTGGDVNAVTWS